MDFLPGQNTPYFSRDFDFKISYRPVNLPGLSRNGPQVAYGRWSLIDIMLSQNFALLAQGNCRDLPRVFRNVLFIWQVNFEKQQIPVICNSHWGISVSVQPRNAIMLQRHCLVCQVVANGTGGQKQKKFKLLALKVVASFTRGGHLQEAPHIVNRLGTFWYFRKLAD